MALFGKKHLNDRHNTSKISKYSKISVESLEKILDTKLYFDVEENHTYSDDMDGYIFSIDGFSSVFVKITGAICTFFKLNEKNKRKWLFFGYGLKNLEFKLDDEARYYTIYYIRNHSDEIKDILDTVEKINK